MVHVFVLGQWITERGQPLVQRYVYINGTHDLSEQLVSKCLDKRVRKCVKYWYSRFEPNYVCRVAPRVNTAKEQKNKYNGEETGRHDGQVRRWYTGKEMCNTRC